MRFGAVPTITIFAAAGFLACNAPMRDTGNGSGSGGATGGIMSAGGTTPQGGTTSAGGTTSQGGNTSAGGSTSQGGTTSAGGATGLAGSTTQGGSGGAGSTGGSAAAGGTTSSGGSSARGGSGGATTSSGGSTGACTDVPPPNQTNPCSDWKTWGNCGTSYLVDNNYCNQTCGRCGGGAAGSGGSSTGGTSARGGSGGAAGAGGTTSSGGASGSGGAAGGGGTTSPGTTNPQISGTNGWASRYWDCCKPSCGWTANSNPPVPACAKDGTTRVGADSTNGCESGGSAFECYDFSPWYDPGTNMAYGFAAYNGVSCGTCFMLQFTGGSNSGTNAGATALKGQQMIVQVINIGGIQANQFDVLIPGGGVGAMNGCATQWGSSTDLGVQYGGLLSECAGDATCMKGKCTSVFGNVSSVLKAGCDWFTGWYSSADNPSLVYKQVSCPSQLTGKTGLSK